MGSDGFIPDAWVQGCPGGLGVCGLVWRVDMGPYEPTPSSAVTCP